MISRKTWILLAGLALWLGVCYALRFGLMENTHWVNVCDGGAEPFACNARRMLGLMVHFGVLAWSSLAVAVVAWLLRARIGVGMAWIALALALPALVLYTATAASFAVVIAGLRLTRAPA